ncbi:MAG TPA: flagellar motor switch protein FliN [Candidatus Solibacter sp.]|nr:flagellar motor switch protein FliN [Candidatus Solibacter sp.]
MAETADPSPIRRFCALWAEGFSRVLASFGVESPVVHSTDPVSAQAPTQEEFDSLVCSRFSASGALKGELLWTAEKAVALQLAQLSKSESPDLSMEFAESHREAYSEFVRRVAAHAAAAYKAESGVEIGLAFQTTVEPAPVTAQSTILQLSGEKFSELSLRLFLDEDLCAALSALPLPATPEQPNPLPGPAPATSMVSEPVARPSGRSTPSPANLALVLDVELESTIRFGECQMLLRDIFGLMAGAVVELDELVSEPAELLVAGRLVARGEVVVVDGCFGLRVSEVANGNALAALNARR